MLSVSKSSMKYFAFFTLLLLPVIAGAQTYQPLLDLGIPGVTDQSGADFGTYVNGLYALSISIAALLAVIKVVIAGVKWMTTDIVTSKGAAKTEIQGALTGLLVVLGAVIILTTINPDTTDVDLSVPQLSAPSYTAPTAAAAPAFTNIGYMDKVLDFKGSGISSLGTNPTDAEMKNMCENVLPADCPDGWTSALEKALGWPEAACYPGTYDSGTETCLVEAADMKLTSYPCKTISENTDTGATTYTCQEAKAACTNAKGTIKQTSPSKIDCGY
jgi:hypothetical protein